MEAHRVVIQHFLDNQFIDGSDIVSLTHQQLLILGRYLVLISIRG
jgi:hypothetical protein